MIILNFHVCLQNTQLFFMPAKKWCKTDSIDFNVLIFDREKSKENVRNPVGVLGGRIFNVTWGNVEQISAAI